MNIKEAEYQTGISRRNIRFYEQKGMLHPARNQDNDYRDYSPQDIERLKLIRALRMVDMSLEDIRDVLQGTATLEQAVAAQEAQLQRKIQDAQTAIRFCRSLGKLGEGAEVDAILREMDQKENRKHLFTQWKQDYKKMCKFLQQATFTFIPDGAVTNPREFTQALLEFARENEVDITITKEGMYPEFTLEGIEYTAERLYTSMGRAPIATLRCTAKHPELLEPDLPKGQKRAMKLLHFAWIPLAVVLASVWVVACNGGLSFLATLDGVVLAIVFPLMVGVMLYRSMLFYYNNKNK
ncbi:MerR family transcriptional regulator [Pseudoflavonifractor sp. An85]|uniref:MerR family transcriptional regulator n=1 Tax=Pseudoflavonifractor sp. An85 TaxID=1965661 RepID=UPI000B36B5B1|nr:MerR family transcriptional regulator [Pseudoflavonifractor sp. An85]OUN21628.1 hypothetical protein B5G37_11060 [Pseudoflavonifractor sp. An85]